MIEAYQGSLSSTLPTPDEAISRLAAACDAPVRSQLVDLVAARGRVLAYDVHSETAFPASTISAMDGYAIRSIDAFGADAASPKMISVTGEVPIGKPPSVPLQPRTAVYVATGSTLPGGADAVIPVEDLLSRTDSEIYVGIPVRAGQHVVPKGDDFSSGDLILRAGTRIGPADLGMLIASGVRQLPVIDAPVIALLSTGDEIVSFDAEPLIGQVRDSNRIALTAALEWLGVRVVQCRHVPDDQIKLRRRLKAALSHCDGVVLSGGSSVGIRDLTGRAIAELGEPGVVVHGIAMKPGKPVIFAAVGQKPIIGLPGNPTAALMVFLTVVVPAFERIFKLTNPAYISYAITERKIAGKRGWTCFVPVRFTRNVGVHHVIPLPLTSSHASTLSRADGYVRIEPDGAAIASGDLVTVYGFPR